MTACPHELWLLWGRRIGRSGRGFRHLVCGSQGQGEWILYVLAEVGEYMDNVSLVIMVVVTRCVVRVSFYV